MKALNDKHAILVRASAAYTNAYVAVTETSTKDCDRMTWFIDHDDDVSAAGTAGALTFKVQARNPKQPKDTAVWFDVHKLATSAISPQEYTYTPSADVKFAFPPGGVPVQGDAMRIVLKAANNGKGAVIVNSYKTRNTGGTS